MIIFGGKRKFAGGLSLELDLHLSLYRKDERETQLRTISWLWASILRNIDVSFTEKGNEKQEDLFWEWR